MRNNSCQFGASIKSSARLSVSFVCVISCFPSGPAGSVSQAQHSRTEVSSHFLQKAQLKRTRLGPPSDSANHDLAEKMFSEYKVIDLFL